MTFNEWSIEIEDASLKASAGDFSKINLIVKQIENLEKDANRLYNLLAIIHGDGGHYVSEFGVEKAYADAKDKIIKARVF